MCYKFTMTILQKSFQFQLYSCSMCTYTFTCTCTLRVHVPVNIVCKGLNGQIKRWITNNCEWVEHWNTLGKVWNEIPSCYWCVRLSHDLLSLSGLVIISSKEEDNNKKNQSENCSLQYNICIPWRDLLFYDMYSSKQ